MTGLMLLAVGLVGQWLLGIAVADLILNGVSGRSRASAEDDKSSWTELAGLGFILGIGTTAGLLFLWSLRGGSLGTVPSVVITVAGFVGGGLVVLRRQRPVLSSTGLVSREDSINLARMQSWQRWCQILVAGFFVLTAIQALQTPQHLWDERASFAIKGIVLWEDKSIDSRDLADPNFVQFHPRYPLLIPLAEQHIYALLGAVDDRLAKIIFPELYLGMVLMMAGALSRRITQASAWLFALLLATIPALVPWEYGFACGQADAPMACYHGASVLYLWDAWDRATREDLSNWLPPALLAGLCGALAAFTKDEGIAFLLADAVAVALVLPISARRFAVVKLCLTVFGTAAMVLVPWFLHRRGLPLTTEANYFGRVSLAKILEKQANLQWQIQHLASRMFWEFSSWGLQWWLAVVSVVTMPRRLANRSQLIPLLDIVGSLLSLMLAGMLAETEVSEHVGGSSHRFLMQLAPVAVLFAAGQLGTPVRQTTK